MRYSRSSIPVTYLHFARLLAALLLAALIPPLPAKPQPALAQTNASPFELAWSSIEIEPTNSVAWGDMDNDGDLDLAAGNSNFIVAGRNRVYRNENGALAKSATWTAPQATNTGSIAWGDVDGDGDLDLAAANVGQPSQIFRNCTVRSPAHDDGCTDTSPLFSSTAVWSSDGTPNPDAKDGIAAWGDYNGDGRLDLAIGNRLYGNSGSILEITPTLVLTVEGDLRRTVWADIDQDSDLDLSMATSTAIMIYRNDGTPPGQSPLFTLTKYPNNQTHALAWGDYDGDGDLDLAVGNGNFDAFVQDRVYRNDSTPSAIQLTLVKTFDRSDSTYSVEWSDYDGDGDLDLAFGNYGSSKLLYRNDGIAANNTPIFTLAWDSTDGEATLDIAWGDYDGDGDEDLAIANFLHPNKLYRNIGGMLRPDPAWSSPLNDAAQSLALGDYDGDGDLDLAAGNNGHERLYRNDAEAGPDAAIAFTPVLTITSDDDTRSVAWGDYDGDGDLDLIAGNDGAEHLYRNDGVIGPAKTPVFTLALTFDLNDDTRSVAWGDYDGDGDLDLAVGNAHQDLLYHNDGVIGPNQTPVFVPIPFSSADDDTYSVAWGDVDNDGDLDLAVGNGGQAGARNVLYRNDGIASSGTTPLFTQIWASAEQDDSRSVAWGDYDGDGQLDLAVGNHGYYAQPNRLYHNEGRAAA